MMGNSCDVRTEISFGQSKAEFKVVIEAFCAVSGLNLVVVLTFKEPVTFSVQFNDATRSHRGCRLSSHG